jgi:hypothetical protein
MLLTVLRVISPLLLMSNSARRAVSFDDLVGAGEQRRRHLDSSVQQKFLLLTYRAFDFRAAALADVSHLN